MQLRQLGHTDLHIAPLVFGGNVFGWTADKAASFALLDRLAEAGLNAIDTADIYSNWVPGHQGGESETIIGEWLKTSGKRGSTIIITKVGGHVGGKISGLAANYIAGACDASLKRLGVETIDLYLSHFPDPDTPYEETLGAFEKLKKAGKIRWFGASNLDAAQLRASLDAGQGRGPAALRSSCSRNTTSTTSPASTGRCATSASPSRSASSPISASPRASSAANTAARPTSGKARAAAASKPISNPRGFAHSRRARPDRGAARRQTRRGGAGLDDAPQRASPRRSPARPTCSKLESLIKAAIAELDRDGHGHARRGQRRRLIVRARRACQASAGDARNKS